MIQICATSSPSGRRKETDLPSGENFGFVSEGPAVNDRDSWSGSLSIAIELCVFISSWSTWERANASMSPFGDRLGVRTDVSLRKKSGWIGSGT